MSSNTDEREVIRVSKKGQTTIPEDLRDRFGIETPGKVLIHEEEQKIVIEPLPAVDEMQGVHAGRYENGDVLEQLRAMNDEDKQLEREGDTRLERKR